MTDSLPSPREFRKWAAIWAVGSAGRRRIWTELVPGRPIYPNLFVFEVGPPGTGKTEAINPAMEHLRKSQTCKLAPNDITKQSLLDNLDQAPDAVILDGLAGPVPTEFHFLAIGIRELSNFMNQYDSALAGLLTDLFDNPPVNHESKRSGSGKVIIRPGISLLAGTATKNLGSTIGNALWGQGFMSRVIMVYSADQPRVAFFGEQTIATVTHEPDPALVTKLSAIGAMKGRVDWEPDAQAAFTEWFDGGQLPKPNHSKLVEYNARRFLHVAKLSLISAMSDARHIILAQDFARALAWLQAAEKAMPEIFKEMVVHSDGEIAREMHMHAFALFSQSRKPVHYAQLASFLMTKVPARDIKRIIENAEEAGMFDRVAGTQGAAAQYIPKADGQLKDIE